MGDEQEPSFDFIGKVDLDADVMAKVGVRIARLQQDVNEFTMTHEANDETVETVAAIVSAAYEEILELVPDPEQRSALADMLGSIPQGATPMFAITGETPDFADAAASQGAGMARNGDELFFRARVRGLERLRKVAKSLSKRVNPEIEDLLVISGEEATSEMADAYRHLGAAYTHLERAYEIELAQLRILTDRMGRS